MLEYIYKYFNVVKQFNNKLCVVPRGAIILFKCPMYRRLNRQKELTTLTLGYCNMYGTMIIIAYHALCNVIIILLAENNFQHLLIMNKHVHNALQYRQTSNQKDHHLPR